MINFKGNYFLTISSLFFIKVLDKWIGYWHDDVILPWDLENDVWMELMEDMSAQEKIPFKGFFNDYKTNGNHKILTAFVGGDLALDIEKKSDMEIQNLAMTSIQGMFPNTTVPIPNEFIVSRWGQDENFLGAYSFPSKDQMYNSKKLTENIDGKLFFAGEACAVIGTCSACRLFRTEKTPYSLQG